MFFCRQPAVQGGQHSLHTDGFGEVIVHAGFDTEVTVALHGIGRHGNDRNAGHIFPGRPVADLTGGFIAIHFRHLAVHQDQGIAFVCRAVQQTGDGLHAIGGKIDLITGAGEQLTCHHLVDLVIFHQQQALSALVAGLRAGVRRGDVGLIQRGQIIAEGNGFGKMHSNAGLMYLFRQRGEIHGGHQHQTGRAAEVFCRQTAGQFQAVAIGWVQIQQGDGGSILPQLLFCRRQRAHLSDAGAPQ